MNNLRHWSVLVFALILIVSPASIEAAVRISPAPPGEEFSAVFEVRVGRQKLPIYQAKVAPAEPARRWKAMDDKARSAEYFDLASFGYFDLAGQTKVSITCPERIQSAKVLPSSAGITPTIQGNRLSFTLSEPRHLTVEVNGRWVNALHLFVNPLEKDAPRSGDPNVIFFGPGIHEVSHLVITNNQTVYVAAGAVVRGIIRPDEPFNISSYSGLRTYSPTFLVRGTNITFRGRGIIDGSRSTTHARNLIQVQGSDIRLEGIILRDSSTWNLPIRRSDRVSVRNLKIIGYRANSDGIDVCNSRDVVIEDCFIRTLDDLIVIKTDKGQGEARRILARNCVLWNEVAHALSVGAELRENVDDVVFRDCDVIHDQGREWTLRIYHCDAARISNVRFENLRIEESPRLISLWIDKAFWSRDPERGHIDGVIFKDLQASASAARIELKGFDATHLIQNVQFQNVLINGAPLSKESVKQNAFVENVTLQP